jgi:hypothetical protein
MPLCDGDRISLHTIPTLVDLSAPMHRTHGHIARQNLHRQCTSPAKTPKPACIGVHVYDVLAEEFGVCQSPHLSATSAAASPDAARVTVRHSPHLSTAVAASGKGSNLASSHRESDDGGDSVTASQVLLSPPPPRTVSYVCNWAQVIRCEYPNLTLPEGRMPEHEVRASSLSECVGAAGGLR